MRRLSEWRERRTIDQWLNMFNDDEVDYLYEMLQDGHSDDVMDAFYADDGLDNYDGDYYGYYDMEEPGYSDLMNVAYVPPRRCEWTLKPRIKPEWAAEAKNKQNCGFVPTAWGGGGGGVVLGAPQTVSISTRSMNPFNGFQKTTVNYLNVHSATLGAGTILYHAQGLPGKDDGTARSSQKGSTPGAFFTVSERFVAAHENHYAYVGQYTVNQDIPVLYLWNLKKMVAAWSTDNDRDNDMVGDEFVKKRGKFRGSMYTDFAGVLRKNGVTVY